MFKTSPLSNLGATIINAEINWLEMEPDICTSPPFTFPSTEIGGFPLFELHLAPIDSRASSIGFIGLFFRLSSPDNTVLP